MKHKLFAFLLAIIASTSMLFAQSGTCGDNLTWNLTNGVLIISGTGEMTDYNSSSPAPWYSYRSSIQYVVIGNGVTSIGNHAFYYCQSLSSVTIPNSVTSIGSWAFQYCSSLTSVTIPNNVISIGGVAFSDCGNLSSIYIPNSVTSIGDYPFTNCTNLTSINVENGNPNYISQDGVLFNKSKTKLIQYPAGKTSSSYVIPSSVTSIGIYAFSYCSNLASVTIPNSVTSINYRAFYACMGLSSLTIPNSVTHIGGEAFCNCTSLTTFIVDDNNMKYCSMGGVLFDKSKSTLIQYPIRKTLSSYAIPKGVKSIESGAFLSCTGLTSVIIPNSVTSIGSCAFYNCSSLASIAIPNSVISIGLCAFQKCTGLTSVMIPNSVTSIENAAFSMCSSLNSVTIGNGVTNIGYQVFYKCTSLLSITIPDGVINIEREAFYHCSQLASVEIPNSVTSIGDKAFNSCTALTSVINYAVTPQTIMLGVFSGVNLTSCTLHVPAESLAAYRTADVWKNFGTIQAIGGDTPCSSISGTCGGNLTWEISCDSVLTISGTGAMADFNSTSDNPWYEHRNAIKSVIIGDGITSIGKGAFYNCSVLTSVAIGNSVTSIEQGAFQNCIDLPSVVIPNSVTSIEYGAFKGCTVLKSITIGNSITSIGDYAFEYCSSLDSVTIPNSVTSIGYGAFGNCSGITSLTIGNSLTSIGNFAFYNCTGLMSVTNYAATPQTISSNVFGSVNISACTLQVSVESVTAYKAATVWKDFGTIQAIGGDSPCSSISGTCGGNLTWKLSCDSVLTISGTGAMTAFNSASDIPWYEYRDAIRSIVIGNGVTSIEQGAFGTCSNLTSVTIPNSVTSIGQVAFYECTALTSVTIPNSVTSIGMGAFSGCSALTSVTLPNGITSIEQETFESCSSLTSVVIPNNVTSIGDWAFESCTALTSVTIPSSVTSISDEVFSGCTALRSVTNYATTPQTIDEYVFDGVNISSCTLHVPAGSRANYQTADVWKEFGRIVPITTEDVDITATTITASSTTADIKWPKVIGAETYTLEIKKNGELICTLTFDEEGHLISMSFAAPSRNYTSQQTQVAGFSFTITGLESGTTYNYTMTVKDNNGNVLKTESGTFTTIGAEGIEDAQSDQVQSTKILRNGQIFIQRGEKIYTITGQEIQSY